MGQRLYSLTDLENLAKRLAEQVTPGDVICLYGTLGVGKTTFSRLFIQALGYQDAVPSPTFTLLQTYETNPVVAHYDLYRLNDPEEILELGLEEAIQQGVVLVEWPGRLGPYLPKDRLEIHLSFATTEEARELEIKKEGQWQSRPLSL